MLVSLGFSVIHVGGAEAALGALANERAIDMVLSDIMMPGDVSGLQLAREIRRRHPEMHIALPPLRRGALRESRTASLSCC
jgi:CheY-like chemotaxis protein